MIEKSYDLLGCDRGRLIVDQYWNTFLNFWKITFEYLTKFTDASYENIFA